MKRSVHTYRMLATATLLLLCTGIHKNLDAGFHLGYLKKEAPRCMVVKRSFLPDDNFMVKAFLRFTSLDEKAARTFERS